MKIKVCIFSLLLMYAFTGIAQDGYKVGDEARSFNLRNVDEKMVSPEDFSDAEGFIIIFTCNHCPFSVKYEDRIIALNEKYATLGYPVLAINPNDSEAYAADSYDNMKKRAEEKGFTFPYLRDKTQIIAKAYGAQKTPHTYVLQKADDGKLYVRYIGAIDDDPSGTDVEEKYVEQAIDALKAGDEIFTPSTSAIGCRIKWL